VFTVPDPDRVEGTVRATKPLSKLGIVMTLLRIRFEHGRAGRIDADQNADVLGALCEQHPDAARLGDRAGRPRQPRVASLGHPFYQPLLDENTASHIALGNAFQFAVTEPRDRERINTSKLHLDCMIGSDQVTATGTQHDGTTVPLLHQGPGKSNPTRPARPHRGALSPPE
jgi:aminopeptidase